MTLKSRLRSFKVIENGTIRNVGYGFLFAFCSNYGLIFIISEMKQDTGDFFRSPPAIDARHVKGVPVGICHNVWYESTRVVRLPDGEKDR